MARETTRKTYDRYRDRLTGRFVKRSTWKRSKAHGGDRYKRERVPRKKEREIEPPPPPVGPVHEWLVSFKYAASGRVLDVIVTARSEAEARAVADKFLQDDPQARRIVAAGFTGWEVTVANAGPTDEEAGEAEFRAASKG